KCNLKVVARNKVAANIHLKFQKFPLHNLTVSVLDLQKIFKKFYFLNLHKQIWGQLLRKSNEYRPFLYNTTVDLCKFLKNGNKFLFWKIVYNVMKPFTNLNHSCPINHDIILDNLIVEERSMKLILFPAGEYQIRLNTLHSKRSKMDVKVYFSVKED
ncbi:hypothetical protein FF38_02847, partial [Lucilia cuprina]